LALCKLGKADCSPGKGAAFSRKKVPSEGDFRELRNFRELCREPYLFLREPTAGNLGASEPSGSLQGGFFLGKPSASLHCRPEKGAVYCSHCSLL
jgi:hypothetical protein